MIYFSITGTGKPKRHRTAFRTNQLRELEALFSKDRYISRKSRIDISTRLHLTEMQVKIWFQNRRAKANRDAADSVGSSSPHSLSSNTSSSSSQCSESHPPVEWAQYFQMNHEEQILMNQYGFQIVEQIEDAPFKSNHLNDDKTLEPFCSNSNPAESVKAMNELGEHLLVELFASKCNWRTVISDCLNMI